MTIDVKGVIELNRLLKQLPGRVARNVARSGLRAGGAVIRDDARANLPSNYGTLKKSIYTKIGRQRSPYLMAARIGPRSGGSKYDGWYGHIVEYGTLGSRAEPVKKSRTVNHATPLPTGLKPIPFMRPAFESSKERAVDAMRQKIIEGVAKEVAKLAKR